MKKSPKWHHKFMYAFGPPGWSHDGSTMTIKEFQNKLKEEAQISLENTVNEEDMKDVKLSA